MGAAMSDGVPAWFAVLVVDFPRSAVEPAISRREVGSGPDARRARATGWRAPQTTCIGGVRAHREMRMETVRARHQRCIIDSVE